jgi:hypothetical protein
MVLGGIMIIIIRSYMAYIGEGLQKLFDDAMVLGGIMVILIRSYMAYIGEGLQKLLDRGVWGNKVLRVLI